MQWRQKKKKKKLSENIWRHIFEQRYIQTAKGCKKRHNVSFSPGYVHLQFIYRLCWILTHIGILCCHPLIVKRTTWLGMGQCETDILHCVLGSNLALMIMSVKLNAVKSKPRVGMLHFSQYNILWKWKDILSSLDVLKPSSLHFCKHVKDMWFCIHVSGHVSVDSHAFLHLCLKRPLL